MFVLGIFKRVYVWIYILFFDPLDLYTKYITPHVSEKHKGYIDMLQNYGLYIFILLVFVAAMKTFHELRVNSKKEIEQIEQSKDLEFYSINQKARIERAVFAFYKLYENGRKNFNKWSHEQKQSWDEDVLKAFSKYCQQDALNLYLLDTGRNDPGGIIAPLLDEKYSIAMKQIKLFLDGRYRISIL